MKTCENGYALIRRYEGLRRTAYKCPAGKWTIGYGHTKGVKEFDTCTNIQAETWLYDDVRDIAEKAISHWVRVPVTQNQYDALASFAFNYGSMKFGGSTLVRKLNAGDAAGAAAQFDRWIYAGDPPEILPGLVLRRAAERKLFETVAMASAAE